jgi:hypothetical protein
MKHTPMIKNLTAVKAPTSAGTLMVEVDDMMVVVMIMVRFVYGSF